MYDYRLVSQMLNQAYDKDPDKLPRQWVRAGCRNEFNKGWTPQEATAKHPQTQADDDAIVAKYEAMAEKAKNDRAKKTEE